MWKNSDTQWSYNAMSPQNVKSCHRSALDYSRFNIRNDTAEELLTITLKTA